MPLWGKFRVAFENWKLMSLESHSIEESEEVKDPFVETKNWKPIKGEHKNGLRIAFVDGVRRTENVVYLEDPDKGVMVEGAFVSVGAGAVVLNYGRPSTLEESLRKVCVERYFLLKEGIDIAQPSLRFYTKAGKLEFKVLRVKKELSPYVNDLMASLESHIAQTVHVSENPELIVTDGTLHYVIKSRGLPFVGYVKKHKRLYLQPEHLGVLSYMSPGERTPLILIHSSSGEEKFDKFTWYVKLSPGDGLTSIARLEVPAEVGIDKAVEIANLTASLIPLFASAEFNDKRAPQNLLPIKYLENFLRRRLGSQTLIRRLIAEFITD